MNEAHIERLRSIQAAIPHMHCRVAPSSFDPLDPDMLVLPRPSNPHWDSCADMLRSVGARGVALCVPLFWQMHSMAKDACARARVPIFINEPANIPLGAISLVRGGVDTIISESATVQAYWSYIVEKHLSLPATWIVIERLGEHWQPPVALVSSAVLFVREVHISPTVPLLIQCTALAAENKPLFHLADEYTLRTVDGSTYVSSALDTPFPYKDFLLPFSLCVSGLCACGKEVFKKSTL